MTSWTSHPSRPRHGDGQASGDLAVADTSSNWHQEGPVAQAAPVGADGKLVVAELTLDRSAAGSPFGDDQVFPLPPEQLRYQHPSAPAATAATDPLCARRPGYGRGAFCMAFA